MRNLCLVTQTVEQSRAFGADAKFTLSFDGSGFVAFECGRVYFKQDTGFDLSSVGVGADDKCVGLVALDDGSAVLALSSGALISTDGTAAEAVGHVDQGLLALSTSPDQEVLVLATGSNTLVFMTREFDPVCEVTLDQDTFGQDAFVNVGWGSKTTQFHGSLGKAAAVTPAASNSSNSSLCANETGRVLMSWRDDGQLVAVSSVCSDRRVVRVFGRDGALLSTAEAVHALEPTLAWMPSGALIASTQKLPSNKYQVIFFERNGLRHGEFTLPLSAADGHVAECVSWNKDSDLLLVSLRDVSQNKSSLFVYSSSNYRWSLKHTLKSDETVIHVEWSATDAKRLHILYSGGEMRAAQFGWLVDHSLGVTSDDHAYVAVTDGTTVRVTPLAQTIIPPPMCAFQIQLPEEVKQVAFHSDDTAPTSSSQVCVLTVAGNLYFFVKKEDDDPEEKNECSVTIKEAGGTGFINKATLLRLWRVAGFLPNAPEPISNMTSLLWVRGDTVVTASCHPKHTVIFWTVNGGQVTEQFRLSCDTAVASLVSDCSGQWISVTLCDGRTTVLPAFDPRSAATPSWSPAIWSSPTWPATWLVSTSQARHVLALTERHRLHMDGAQVADDVTSLAVTPHFVLATTTRHKLTCLPLNKLHKAKSPSCWISETSVRALERGSRLITSTWSGATVLQMPRGNLEAIHPRAVTLHFAKDSLDRTQFDEAYATLRRHRINLNLMVDHQPDLFMANVDKFVAQMMADVQRICLFVADLVDEDTTFTMYSAHYDLAERSSSSVFQSSGKVLSVCSRLLEAMEATTDSRLLQAVVSCYVRLGQADQALQKIAEYRGTDLSVAEDALRFLLVLVDVNALFDVALGTYDFELVLFVAEKSQKDPKEYVPFLNELRRLQPTELRRFRIDVHLKRFVRALGHVAALDGSQDVVDECVRIVADNRIYTQAVAVLRKESNAHKAVCKSYGEYLISKKYYEDAGLVFELGGHVSEAVDAWAQSGNWRMCASLARSVQSPSTTEVFCRLVEGLKQRGRLQDAADVLVECLGRQEEAVEALVEARAWAKALHLIVTMNRSDLNETHLLPGLRAHRESCQLSISDAKSTFSTQLSRLEAVVAGKRVRSAAVAEDDHEGDDADLYSEAGSVVTAAASVGNASSPATLQTRVSARSKTSSRQRRRNERKKYSAREGSVHEDVALVASLHGVITNVYKLTDEVGELNRVLVRFGLLDWSRTLQADMTCLLALVDGAVNRIWMEPKAEDAEIFGPEATVADIVNKATGNSAEASPICYALLDLHLRFPPRKDQLVKETWRLAFLEEITAKK